MGWRSAARRPATGCVLVALGAVVFAGCGRTTVDHRQIEARLVASVSGQKPDVMTTAACPSGATAKVGATFTCRLTLDGDPVAYLVTVSSVHGPRFDADTRPAQPIIDTRVVSSSVRDQLGADGAQASVSCGPHRFVQVAVKATFGCTASTGAQQVALTATVEDDQGNVSFRTAGAAPDASVWVHAPTTTVAP